jgi:putative membrane-bound dehydrogenase-like protein
MRGLHAACLVWVSAIGAAACMTDEPERPRVLDERLEINLIARDPELVTPVGLVVDDAGRVIVIESHTHFRPEDYDGPPADRIRQFTDKDGDGTFEDVLTIFEGSKFTMQLALEHDGSLVVAARGSVFRLRRDEGGRVTAREELLRLETPQEYPHNGLSGLAVDLDGSIYVGMGENMGIAYTLRAAKDGATFQGGGEGGNVFRINRDGSGLERFATGFWNPFALALDAYGRLFTVDNDPDSSPPCRFIHVVKHGDYGYRFRNGRKGLHPFTSWNGQLAGTLPMASGTGEAPSGLVVYDSISLPEDFRGTLLATSWGDHDIERFRAEPMGATLPATRDVVVQGGKNFRPVGIAVAPDGSLFITDWVDRSYTIHRQGRLWRIHTRDASKILTTDSIYSNDNRRRERAARRLAETERGRGELRTIALDRTQPPVARALAIRMLLAVGDRDPSLRALLDESDTTLRALAVRAFPRDWLDLDALAADGQPAEVRAEALRRWEAARGSASPLAALSGRDPFLSQAAIVALGRASSTQELLALAPDRNQPLPVRLASLVLLRERNEPRSTSVLTQTLDDPDPDIRLLSLQWVAERELAEMRPNLANAMTAGPIDTRLFAAYVVALGRLDRDPKVLDLELPSQPISAKLALDESLPPAVRAMALRSVTPDNKAVATSALLDLLSASAPELRLEVTRLLALRGGEEAESALAAIAADPAAPEPLRAEAIAALASNAAKHKPLLINLLGDPSATLRRQAARSLRGVELSSEELGMIEKAGVGPILDPLASGRDPDPKADPASFLATTGDSAEGERVFFHPRGPACFKCHQVDRRGARIGPDLTRLHESATAERLLDSIMNPSHEIAPQFVTWQIAMKDGTVYSVMQFDDRGDDAMYVDNQGEKRILKMKEIETRAASNVSIMPENLPDLMTRQELRDLIAYLRNPLSYQGTPPKSARTSP